MSSLTIDYSQLKTIASNADSLAQKTESYCSELGSDVYSKFDSVTAGVNDVLASAMYYVAAKQKSLTEKAEEYYAFAGKVVTLIDHAKQADKDVATKIENNQEDFLKKNSDIKAAEGIEAFLINLFVDIKNACPLFEIIIDCTIAICDEIDSALDALKYFYECGGGKELVELIVAAVAVVAAVAALIACFPVSLALSWAGLVALAGVVGAGIGLANAVTDLATSAMALKSRLDGDPAWASIYGKQDKLSDVLRDTNFGDGTLNKLSYGAATTLDVTETVCDVINVADMAKNMYKAGPQVSERLDISSTNAAGEKQFVDNPFDEAGNLKPNVKYTSGEFGYNYETDDMGRLTNWQADELHLTDRTSRLKHDANTPGKLAGDHAGHLAGDRFGGSPKLDNLVSQDSHVNLSDYKKIENTWADALKEGKNVSTNVSVVYEANSVRPSKFIVDYSIDGELFSAEIFN